MKLSRKLVPAIAMLLVSAVMLSTASFAWFSMNTTVKATDMSVQAQAMGSLVIATQDDFDTAVFDDLYTKVTTVAKDPAPGKTLIDVTHIDTVAGDKWTGEATTGFVTSASGLKTVDEGVRSTVDNQDGSYTGAYVAAVNGDKTYYKDYVFFIAAKAQNITAPAGKVNNLKATVTATTTLPYSQAVAVDFFVDQTNGHATVAGESTYQGTVHLDTTGSENVTDESIFDGMIPVANETNGYVKVIMRVYIDGAYKGSESAPIANNKTWKSGEIKFDVTFNLSTVNQ